MGTKNIKVSKVSRLYRPDYIIYATGFTEIDSVFMEGGCGYFIVDTCTGEITREAYKGLLHTTNYRCDLLPIISGLRYVPSKSKVLIYTSNKILCNTLSGRWKAKSDLDLMDMYKAESSRLSKIRLSYVGKFDDQLMSQVSCGSLSAMRSVVEGNGLHKGAVYRRFISHEDVDMKSIFSKKRKQDHRQLDLFVPCQSRLSLQV